VAVESAEKVTKLRMDVACSIFEKWIPLESEESFSNNG
jgi:hypothetical protein